MVWLLTEQKYAIHKSDMDRSAAALINQVCRYLILALEIALSTLTFCSVSNMVCFKDGNISLSFLLVYLRFSKNR